jgi:branched-chain amino acid transport system substrate-binding protein
MITRRRILSVAGAAAAVAGFGGAHAAARPIVGITLPLTGVQAPVGKELRLGYEAALGDVADLDIQDDEFKELKTSGNMAAFAANPQIIASTGIVGTPHARAAIKAAVAGQLPVVGIKSARVPRICATATSLSFTCARRTRTKLAR